MKKRKLSLRRFGEKQPSQTEEPSESQRSQNTGQPLPETKSLQVKLARVSQIDAGALQLKKSQESSPDDTLNPYCCICSLPILAPANLELDAEKLNAFISLIFTSNFVDSTKITLELDDLLTKTCEKCIHYIIHIVKVNDEIQSLRNTLDELVQVVQFCLRSSYGGTGNNSNSDSILTSSMLDDAEVTTSPLIKVEPVENDEDETSDEDFNRFDVSVSDDSSDDHISSENSSSSDFSSSEVDFGRKGRTLGKSRTRATKISSPKRKQILAEYFNIETEKGDDCEETKNLYTKYLKLRGNLRIDWRCEKCDISFGSKKEVLGHMTEEHVGSQLYRCKLCSLTYSNRSSAYTHGKRHENLVENENPTARKKIERTKTSKKSSRKEKAPSVIEKKTAVLHQHFKITLLMKGDSDVETRKFYRNSRTIKHNAGDPWKCRLCDEVYESHLSLREHIASNHLDVYEYKCQSCSYVSNRRYCAYAHLYSHHSNAVESEDTPDDDEDKDNAKDVRDTDAAEGEETVCDYNKEEFDVARRKEKIQMKDYFKVTHVTKGDGCMAAKRCFQNLRSLRISPESKWKCCSCESEFDTKRQLSSHLIEVHLGKSLYECKFCPQSFEIRHRAAWHASCHKDVGMDLMKRSTNHTGSTFRRRLKNRSQPSSTEGTENASISDSSLLEKYFTVMVKKGDGTEKKSRKWLIKINRLVASQQQEWKCITCGTTFSSKVELKSHLQNVHCDQHRYRCKVCDVSLIRRKTAFYHAGLHEANEGHQCNICLRRFGSEQSKLMHMKIDPHDYKCPSCDFRTVKSSEYKRHLKQQHQHTLKSINVCGTCKKTFATHKVLAAHRARVCGKLPEVQALLEDEEKSKRYKCSVATCFDAEFGSLKEYKAHMKYQHDVGRRRKRQPEKRFVCEYCGVTLIGFSSYGKHKRRLHFKEKNFTCPYRYCDRSYFTPGELKRHAIKYHGEQGFECGTCGRTYQTAHSLKSHVSRNKCDVYMAIDRKRRLEEESSFGKPKNTRNYKNNPRKYQCIMCPHMLSKKPRVISHLKKVHSLTDEEIEPYLEQINNLPNLAVPERSRKKHKKATSENEGNSSKTEEIVIEEPVPISISTVVIDNNEYTTISSADALQLFQ